MPRHLNAYAAKASIHAFANLIAAEGVDGAGEPGFLTDRPPCVRGGALALDQTLALGGILYVAGCQEASRLGDVCCSFAITSFLDFRLGRAHQRDHRVVFGPAGHIPVSSVHAILAWLAGSLEGGTIPFALQRAQVFVHRRGVGVTRPGKW